MVPKFDAENALSEYLKSRGWAAQKMDENTKDMPNGEQAADWLFMLDNYRFLAEVKTIESTRRGIDTEAGLDQKHGLRRTVRHLSQRKEFAALPFDVLVDNQRLYVPNRAEVDQFITWLQHHLELLAAHTLPRGWVATPISVGSHPYTLFFTRYLMGTDSSLDVRVMPKSPAVLYQYDVNAYGSLNTSAVNGEIRKARRQLHKTVSRLQDDSATMPRVVVLYFGLGYDPFLHTRQLFEKIQNTFITHRDLSAIAVLRFVPTSKDFWSHEVTMGFWVFHNDVPDLECPLLKTSVFEDPYTQQYSLESLRVEIEKMQKSHLFY